MNNGTQQPAFRLLDFRPRGGDDSGWLISLQTHEQVPFDIRRVYYIFGTQQGICRGMHAHRDLEQVVVCVSGRCTFRVDDGFQREVYCLDSPQRGIYLGNNVWREMSHFSPNCVLIVLASRHYDPTDYIKDYNEFLARVRGKDGKEA